MLIKRKVWSTKAFEQSVESLIESRCTYFLVYFIPVFSFNFFLDFVLNSFVSPGATREKYFYQKYLTCKLCPF